MSAPIAAVTYTQVGDLWDLSSSGKYDPIGRELCRNHYSRRKPESPQFMPPGETFVLISRDKRAVWGWWRPHPRSGIRAMNKLDGWTCSLFANHGGTRSSELVLDAEASLRWLDSHGRTAAPCGPDGLLTYVDPKKIRSSNPGCCFKLAGWRFRGLDAKGRKHLLGKAYL